jgi:hypothetical protein
MYYGEIVISCKDCVLTGKLSRLETSFDVLQSVSCLLDEVYLYCKFSLYETVTL